MSKNPGENKDNCPCGSSKSFSQCCGPLLEGKVQANSPEQLMRSRYSAFAKRLIDYVIATTDPQARADMNLASVQEWMDGSDFTKLEILRSTDEGNKGTVEFKAYYQMNKEDCIHHEISKFRKHGGIWYFRDGRVVRDAAKP